MSDNYIATISPWASLEQSLKVADRSRSLPYNYAATLRKGIRLILTSDIPDSIDASELSDLAEQRVLLCQDADNNVERIAAAQYLMSDGAVIMTPLVYRAWANQRIAAHGWQLSVGMDGSDGRTVDALIKFLAEQTYERVRSIESPGEWSRRGGVVDVWSPDAPHPVRLDYFGDELERIRTFYADSQLTRETVETFTVRGLVASDDDLAFVDIASTIPMRAYDRAACVRSLINVEHDSEERETEAAEQLLIASNLTKDWVEIEEVAADDPVRSGLAPFNLPPATAAGGKFPLEPRFLALKRALREGKHIWMSIPTHRHLKSLRMLAEPYALSISMVEEMPKHWPPPDAKPSITAWTGPALPNYQHNHMIWLDESDIVRGGGLAPRRVAVTSRAPLISLDEIVPGDYLVHQDYGLCTFKQLERRDFNGIEQEFIRLIFADSGSLLLPVDRIYLLEKKASADENTPLDKLGSGRFAKKKQKAKEDALRYAHTLLKQTARRVGGDAPKLVCEGKVSSALDLSFAFTLTPDQDRAIEEIYADVATDQPMDRLLVGDVGFGKTEVALRAVGCAVDSQQQAVVLAPTTILAYQHARHFDERLQALGVTTGHVSRFRTPSENEATMRAFAEGTIDVLVGTHRILQRDFYAPRLGMIVVDEEQKFGVMQKEKLAGLSKQAHRLSMSATPIPRSLNMALAGQRAISTITTPPPSRQAVETSIVPLDHEILTGILQRELDREGQVYVVAPRIQDLEGIADSIREWAPEAKVGVGHGQMSGKDLEELFLSFWEKRIDILVSTTIVESGLDVANANTMLIWNGQYFGLADLYQLRGRVGRSDRKGYCKLVVPHAATLSDHARKRLEAIEKFSKLGSGYQVALYDLEIRGAGEVLGTKQHGHVQSIGMGMYARLLEEAIAEVAEEPILRLPEPEIRTWFSTSLPVDNLTDAQRIEIYRALFVVENQTDFTDRSANIQDRYNLPASVLAPLGYAAMLRGYARQIGLATCEWKSDRIQLALHPEANLDRAGLVAYVQEHQLDLRPDAVSIALPPPPDATDDENGQETDQETGEIIDPILIQAQSLEKQWEILLPHLASIARLTTEPES